MSELKVRFAPVLVVAARAHRWFAGRPALCSILAFAFIAYLDFSASFGRSIAASFGGDMTMILTRAVADLRPEVYANDFVFSSPQNYTFYTNASVYLFQLADYLRGGGVGFEYHVFGAIVTFLFLFGWYRLFQEVSPSHWWSVLFALTVAVAVPMIVGDYWGLYNEPQPRVQFSTLLPFLLLLGIRAHTDIRLWLVTFGLAGLGMWIHPASAPPVALSLMFAMGLTSLCSAGFLRTVWLCVISGAVFLTIALPNMWMYYSSISQAATGADPSIVREALLMRYDQGYSEPLQGIWTLFSRALSGPRVALLAIFVAGACLAAARRDRKALFVVVFGLGLVLFGGGIPVAEDILARLSDRAPSQLDLIRSLRYLVPVLLFVSFWACAAVVRGAALRSSVPIALLVMWLAAAYWPPIWPQSRSVVQGLKCLVRFQVVCRSNTSDPLERVMEFARSTSPDTMFFSPDQGPRIRAFAERPLSFGWKDMGWLAYSNHKLFAEKIDLLSRYKELAARPAGPQTTSQWIQFGKETGADYVVIRNASSLSEPVKVAFSAGVYTVFDLSDTE
ncbi:hypothetical protein GR158_12425 [Shinella sp. AETb1-6]|uniref:hypothetical protein n=1 Tax=Shinella sp. AETb1-6 TaxID=2692210 RepID=UPI00136917DC|nr:hypothetical protein [Shinella sp. AETb1-6]MXN51929.1 hypothetical protein [Shinella sp. AETb1-6]